MDLIKYGILLSKYGREHYQDSSRVLARRVLQCWFNREIIFLCLSVELFRDRLTR